MSILTKNLLIISAASLALGGCSLPFGLGQSAVPPNAPQGKVAQAGKCTITTTHDAQPSTMEITVKGKKFLLKGQNIATAPEQTAMYTVPSVSPAAAQVSYMLNDGEFMYIWQDQAKTGFKTKLPPEVTPAEQLDKPDSSAPGSSSPAPGKDPHNPLDRFKADEDYRIECQQGSVDDSTFTPPTEINFMSFDQQQLPAMSGEAGFKIDPKTGKTALPENGGDQ